MDPMKLLYHSIVNTVNETEDPAKIRKIIRSFYECSSIAQKGIQPEWSEVSSHYDNINDISELRNVAIVLCKESYNMEMICKIKKIDLHLLAKMYEAIN